jgi:hypothetical protein
VSESGGFERTDREYLVGIRRDVRYMREEMEKEYKATSDALRDHETRIRLLENFRWWLIGAVVASGGLGALISRVVR